MKTNARTWFLSGMVAGGICLGLMLSTGLGVGLGVGLSRGEAAGKNVTTARKPSEWEPQPAKVPRDGKLRVIVFGAHPDDPELAAGGTALKWARQGHHVKLVAMTNGDVGHWQMAGGALAQRRRAEVEAVSKLFGTTVEVLDNHDGELMPTLENRKKVVRLIRNWGADIVISHRPEDYHPDHRNTGLVVRDAGYMAMVPYFCPDTPYLPKNPIFLFSGDNFTRPNEFRADVAVPLDDVIEKKLDGIAVMESQFTEGGCCPPEKIMPVDRAAAREQGKVKFRERHKRFAERFRKTLVEQYGPEKGGKIQYAEVFELGEYGTMPAIAELRKLFPL